MTVTKEYALMKAIEIAKTTFVNQNTDVLELADRIVAWFEKEEETVNG